MRFLDRGQVKYRTRLIRQLPAAQRFARCLSSNTRFEGVMVVKSRHCRGAGYFVIYAPRNEARKQVVVARMQSERMARTLREEAYYRWSPDGLDADAAYCRTLSGNTYHVTYEQCTCPDYTGTCAEAGILCKHQLAWARFSDPFREEVAA